MGELDALTQVGASAGVRIHPAASAVELPYELWRCLVAVWNQKNAPEGETQQSFHVTNDPDW